MTLQIYRQQAAVWALDPTAHPAHAQAQRLLPATVFARLCTSSSITPPAALLQQIDESMAVTHPVGRDSALVAPQPLPVEAVMPMCGRGPACPAVFVPAAGCPVAHTLTAARVVAEMFTLPAVVAAGADWSAACPGKEAMAYVGTTVQLLHAGSDGGIDCADRASKGGPFVLLSCCPGTEGGDPTLCTLAHAADPAAAPFSATVDTIAIVPASCAVCKLQYCSYKCFEEDKAVHTKQCPFKHAR
jgi:hypothetical protein